MSTQRAATYPLSSLVVQKALRLLGYPNLKLDGLTGTQETIPALNAVIRRFSSLAPSAVYSVSSDMRTTTFKIEALMTTFRTAGAQYDAAQAAALSATAHPSTLAQASAPSTSTPAAPAPSVFNKLPPAPVNRNEVASADERVYTPDAYSGKGNYSEPATEDTAMALSTTSTKGLVSPPVPLQTPAAPSSWYESIPWWGWALGGVGLLLMLGGKRR